ncbi:hypothetical protein PAPYR_8942 [Paratrimastix pyriformis]|uniref:STAS domain-containing protein n=1 Tax=Paratrimastix pyriformis TaxID=342808 RepID=A0ABQ8U9L0_9EUKA|nr:hypothetical protein PAPYR_8942 [Paratrimastix pyriformis]
MGQMRGEGPQAFGHGRAAPHFESFQGVELRNEVPLVSGTKMRLTLAWPALVALDLTSLPPGKPMLLSPGGCPHLRELHARVTGVMEPRMALVDLPALEVADISMIRMDVLVVRRFRPQARASFAFAGLMEIFRQTPNLVELAGLVVATTPEKLAALWATLPRLADADPETGQP